VHQFVGRPLVQGYDELKTPFDGVMITDVVDARRSFDEAVKIYGADRVLAPSLLGLPTSEREAVPQ
jgi:hypothetical protein